jgi:hypothetical protein
MSLTDVVEDKKNAILPEDYNKFWTEYRHITREGIASFLDVEIRNLYAEMSMAESTQQILVGIIEKKLDSAKYNLYISEVKLLNNIFPSGSMNSRIPKVHGHEEYLEHSEIKENIMLRLITAKAELAGLSTATGALSREMTMRLKQ